jgi:bacillithiol biosynthesis cysteine-adding enzyme BshC
MDAQYIDYEDTHSFSKAVIRYIQQDGSLKPFYDQPANLKGFRTLLTNKKVTTDRDLLYQSLTKQYEGISEKSFLFQHNLEQLKKENTFTVTTGHQLNIFTGPLYFIFKIVTAINLAKELRKEFPDKNFVPVYWMATEDHDFAEINHTYIGGKKIEWQNEASGATGRINTQSIADALNEYKAVLGISTNAEKLSKWISDAYTQHDKLADATRYLVNKLFGDYGLIIIDADDRGLKKLFAPVIKEDIIHQNSFNHISDSNKKLAEIHIEAQVNPREINFFYLTEGLRERIILENGLYLVNNTDLTFSKEELLAEIDNHPDRFSPNVVMRPLYQEIILPNLAYIGGGAEIIYWLQLKSTFEHYKIDFPVLLLRNSALITDKKASNKLQRLQLCYQDLFYSLDKIKSNWVSKQSAHVLSLKDEWREIDSIFAKLKLRIHKIDPTLSPSTEAVKVRLEKAMRNLEKKLVKAEKKNFADALNDIEKIKNSLFPNGGLQERKENFGLFYVKYGDEFIKSLIEDFKPLDLKFTIINGVSHFC